MSAPLVLQRRVTLPVSGKNVVVVSINRPDQLNCFNTGVCLALAQVFGSLKHETDLAAIVFTGEGRSFCAGADLSNPPSPLDQSSELDECLANNPVHQMEQLKVPLIGALKGYVVTGGFELALACDILVGDETVVFRDTHCKFGLAPCWGLSQKLQRRIGPGRAKLISLGAIPVRANQAHQWGLLDDLVENDSMKKALEIADYIGKNQTTMVIRYKRAIEEGGRVDLEKGLQRERALGLAHYLEIVGDGETFSNAKEFITDDSRPRSKL